MKITTKTVTRMADLSRLELTGEETARMTAQLERIAASMDVLSQLPAGGAEGTSHAFPVCNVLREDAPLPSLDRAALLVNAPETDGETFLVPLVVAQETAHE